ncbi:hypothetical protein F2Q69_00028682 [Brassica cretica]|uniref:Uncharacterized protein n=1 Tax=Brassica cretica TaxID=69181 RepID=A0A8S9S271_BRACR|nr:hypothetical protein F2Q69_00028682 [Brassica cretica]
MILTVDEASCVNRYVSDAFNNNHSNTDTNNAGDKKLSEACRHIKHIGEFNNNHSSSSASLVLVTTMW